MEIKDFEKLKKDIEEAKAKRSRIDGAIEQDMKRLKDEFGCSTVEEAEQKLKDLAFDIDKHEKSLDDILKEIEQLTDWEKV